MALIPAALLCKRGLAKKVLQLLNEKQSLPKVGILAGQAVASAIDEVLGVGKPVYNDVDIFLTESDWSWEKEPKIVKKYPSLALSNARPGRLIAINAVAGPMEPLLMPNQLQNEYTTAFSHHELYSVYRTSREGLINKILVQFKSAVVEHVTRAPLLQSRCTQALILGFDINCTQVAINLRSNKLYFTPAFQRYFENRQLLLTNMHTPFQTLLRYFKKRQELVTYGDDTATLELIRRVVLLNEGSAMHRSKRVATFKEGLTYLIQNDRAAIQEEHNQLQLAIGHPSSVPGLGYSVGTGLHGVPLALGKKYHQLLDQFGHKLEPYFATAMHPNEKVWLLHSKDDAPALPELKPLTTSPSRQPKRFFEISHPVSKMVKARLDIFEEFLSQIPKGFRVDYQNELTRQGHDYIEGIELQARSELAHILNHHNEAFTPVLPLPFKHQIEFVRKIRQGLKRINQPKAWGILANRSPAWANAVLFDETLLDKALKDLQGSFEPLATPLLLPETFNGATISELNSSYALLSEGSRMNHCVGGYAHAVRSERCRIISIRTGESRLEASTSQWQAGENTKEKCFFEDGKQSFRPLKVSLMQTRTFSNEDPSSGLLSLEKGLRDIVNKWLAENPVEGWKILWPTKAVQLEKAIEQSKRTLQQIV